MAATLIQSAGGLNATASDPVSFANTTTGNVLVAYFGSPTTGRTVSVSDNVNGAYSVDATGVSSAGIATFFNIAGGPVTVTGLLSGVNTTTVMIIEEWNLGGAYSGSQFDQHAAGTVTTATSGTSATTPTLSQASELVLAMLVLNNNGGAGFTIQSPYTASPSSPQASGASIYIACGNLQVSSTNGVNASFAWTNSQSGRFVVATYKLPAVSTGDPLLGQGIY